MKLHVQVVIDTEDGAPEVVEEIATVQRGALQPETVGLTLAEAKGLLQGVQQVLVPRQVAEYVAQQQCCGECGRPRRRKGRHVIVLRSLFGRLHLASPRFRTCRCQPWAQKSVSPVAALLPERATPELLYLEAKAAAQLSSYGRAVAWLQETLPLDGQIGTTSLRRQVASVADRLESALSPEEPTVPGCPRDWEQLPDPAGPLTVGLDGGDVHGRPGECGQGSSFEIIVGKSMPAEGATKCFGFVAGYDTNPRRRLVETLRAQGMQLNQQVTFLSDGGDTVRDLPLYLYPEAEHRLDWFHLTMRLTVMGQMAKSVRSRDTPTLAADLARMLESLKWYLWHGNVFRALQKIDDLEFDLEPLESSAEARKLLKAVREFGTFLRANRAFLTNYGERYRFGETISTAFVESTVNWVISKRMVKQQQMRWTRQGAHHLLQVRLQVLNGDLRSTVCRWYPAMTPDEPENQAAA